MLRYEHMGCSFAQQQQQFEIGWINTCTHLNIVDCMCIRSHILKFDLDACWLHQFFVPFSHTFNVLFLSLFFFVDFVIIITDNNKYATTAHVHTPTSIHLAHYIASLGKTVLVKCNTINVFLFLYKSYVPYLLKEWKKIQDNKNQNIYNP